MSSTSRWKRQSRKTRDQTARMVARLELHHGMCTSNRYKLDIWPSRPDRTASSRRPSRVGGSSPSRVEPGQYCSLVFLGTARMFYVSVSHNGAVLKLSLSRSSCVFRSIVSPVLRLPISKTSNLLLAVRQPVIGRQSLANQSMCIRPRVSTGPSVLRRCRKAQGKGIPCDI